MQMLRYSATSCKTTNKIQCAHSENYAVSAKHKINTNTWSDLCTLLGYTCNNAAFLGGGEFGSIRFSSIFGFNSKIIPNNQIRPF